MCRCRWELGYAMEDRLVVAFALLSAMTAGIGWAGVRHMAKRRAFKLRQMGRGKSDERLTGD